MRRRRRSVFRIVLSANASDISVCETSDCKISGRRRSRAKERDETNGPGPSDFGARDRSGSTLRGTRVTFSRAMPLCSKDERKFSSFGSSSRLTCFRRRATDSNAVTRRNRITWMEPIGSCKSSGKSFLAPKNLARSSERVREDIRGDLTNSQEF